MRQAGNEVFYRFGDQVVCMKIPTEVQDLSHMGLERMYRDSLHHYDWHTRKEIYRFFKEMYPGQCDIIRGWLAVLAAQRVLPFFTHTFPEDNLPVRLLDTAILVVERKTKVADSTIEDLINEGYERLGIDAVHWHGKVAYNAEYAGWSCYKVLLEAYGKYDLFGHLDKWEKDSLTGAMAFGVRDGAGGIAGWRSSEMFTDEDIAIMGDSGDTAGAAAMASACAVEVHQIDSNKLMTFWEWWVNSAMREAWNKI
jgi:hypothetical protein